MSSSRLTGDRSNKMTEQEKAAIPRYSKEQLTPCKAAKMLALPTELDPRIGFLSIQATRKWLNVGNSLLGELKSALEAMSLIDRLRRREGYRREELLLLLALRIHTIAQGKELGYNAMMDDGRSASGQANS
ncbi:MAG: hypothetical protein F6J93_03580 [Oscillatoria sp. SIO1A7]|nr:hypothetical protein [Oscillatoria sp. SIO1A7]